MAWGTEASRAKELKKLIGKYFDPIYVKEFKIPKYNGKATVLSAGGSVAAKILAMSGKWSKEDHLRLAQIFHSMAEKASRAWGVIAEKAAMETWGRPYRFTDYRISGIASDEFSEPMKDKLRLQAHKAGVAKELSAAHTDAAKVQGRYKFTYPVKSNPVRGTMNTKYTVSLYSNGKRTVKEIVAPAAWNAAKKFADKYFPGRDVFPGRKEQPVSKGDSIYSVWSFEVAGIGRVYVYDGVGVFKNNPGRSKKEIETDFKRRYRAEVKAGGKVEINYGLPYVSVTMSDGDEYFFQGDEAKELLDSVPDYINDKVFILVSAQGW